MILCVDIKALKTSEEVQKDVDLEDLLNNHTKYYDDVKEALLDNFVPLDFSTSIRSIYSNLVVENSKFGGKRYYTNITDVQPFPHKGYDLIMFLSSIGVMHSIDYAIGFDDLMMKHSQFQPIGIYYKGSFLNPIIYTHIIISDEGIEELRNYLKEGVDIVSIKDMKTEGNVIALTNTLIEVKEENKDAEQSNDN